MARAERLSERLARARLGLLAAVDRVQNRLGRYVSLQLLDLAADFMVDPEMCRNRLHHRPDLGHFVLGEEPIARPPLVPR